MEVRAIIDELTTFLGSHEVSGQTKLACGEIIEDLRTNHDGENGQILCNKRNKFSEVPRLPPFVLVTQQEFRKTVVMEEKERQINI